MNVLKLVTIPVKIVTNWYLQKIDKDRTNKLKNKYKKLLNNELSADEISYEELVEVNIERIDELFEISISEEESIKLDIYKRIYKAIRNNTINKKDYSKFMRITKNLPSEALSLLPKIYVYIQNQNRTRIPLGDFLNSIKRKDPYLCNSLMNEALLNKEPCCGGFNVIPTPLIIDVTKLFFNEDDLTIKKQNIKKWDCSIHIMNSGDFNGEQKQVINLLEQVDIKGHFGLTYATDLKNSLILNLIIIFKNVDIDTSLINKLKEIPKRINIFKITFDENTVDPIPEIGDKLIYIDLKDNASKNSFIHSFVVQ